MATCFLFHNPAMAGDVGAAGSGNWNAGATWLGGTAPGAGDNVYIGSNFPAGSALSALVTLTQNQSANQVFLGFSAGSSGTLDLGNFILSADSLSLGAGGSAAILRGTGYFTVTDLTINGSNALTMNASDTAGTVNLTNGANLTTAASTNIASHINVSSGSLLTLGANLDVSGSIIGSVNLSGAGSTINAAGRDITTGSFGLLTIGSGTSLLNRGKITGSLAVVNQNFTLNATDVINGSDGFSLTNGTTSLASGVVVNKLVLNTNAIGTTTQTGNITHNVELNSGSLLTLGASLDVSTNIIGSVTLAGAGTTLNAAGFDIKVGSFGELTIGSGTILQNRGKITGSVTVVNQNFTILPTDMINGSNGFTLTNGTTALGAGATVNILTLNTNAVATTTQTGNITGFAFVNSGSLLTLGAPLDFSGSVNGDLTISGAGSIVNAAGFDITVDDTGVLTIGSGAQLQNRGRIIGNLSVTNQGFTLNPTDIINGSFGFTLTNGATALGAGVVVNKLTLNTNAIGSTTQTGNITQNVEINSGSTLNLGAALDVSALNIGGVTLAGAGSTLNAAGFDITTGAFGTLTIGSGTNLLARGKITGSVTVVNQNFTILPTDVINGATGFTLTNGATTLGAGAAVNNLVLNTGAMATTTQTANITNNATVNSGSLLTLGAALNVSALNIGSVTLSGAGSTINAQGFDITTGAFGTLTIGTGTNLLNRGKITGSLSVTGQNFDLTPADVINGSTGFTIAGGSTTLNAGIVVNTLRLNAGGIAIATASSTNNVTGIFNIPAGTLSVPAGATYTSAASSTITLSGGSVSGSGTLIVNGTFTYTGGSFTATTLTNNGTVNVNAGTFNLGSATVSNVSGGTLAGGAWTVGNNTNLNFGAVALTTLGAGATVTLNGANSTFAAINTLATNNGTFRLGGGRTFVPGATFNNQGVLDILAGTLNLSTASVANFAANTLTGGTWNAGATGTINLGAGNLITTLAPGTSVSLTGSGSLFVAINTLATNNGSFQVTGGRNFTTAGALVNNGSMAVGLSSTIVVAGNLTNAPGATLAVAGGATLTIQGVFTNNGTYNNSGSVTTNDAAFFNGGTVVTTGSLNFGTTLTVNNSTTVAGGTVNVTGASSLNANLTFNANTVYGGAGTVTVANNAFLNAVDPTTAINKPVTVQSGGGIGGSGVVGNVLIINAGGRIAPGNSPGLITILDSLDLRGIYDFDLPGNKDNASGGPGTDFDTIGGGGPGSAVVIGSNSSVRIRHGGIDQSGVAAPPFANAPFWQLPHTWTLARVATTGTIALENPSSIGTTLLDLNGVPVDYAPFGFFSYSSGQQTFNNVTYNTYDMSWTFAPVPEPAGFLLLSGAVIGCRALRKRRGVGGNG